MAREVFGSIETVAIPSLGISEVVAKVDTGAWNGAIHCTDVALHGGKLYFTPFGNEKLVTSVEEFETRRVRSANGQIEERYVIPVALVIKGKNYQATIGLSDRTLMRREMLLGRKFLIENNILVDVTLSLDDDHEVEVGLL